MFPVGWSCFTKVCSPRVQKQYVRCKILSWNFDFKRAVSRGVLVGYCSRNVVCTLFRPPDSRFFVVTGQGERAPAGAAQDQAAARGALQDHLHAFDHAWPRTGPVPPQRGLVIPGSPTSRKITRRCLIHIICAMNLTNLFKYHQYSTRVPNCWYFNRRLYDPS